MSQANVKAISPTPAASSQPGYQPESALHDADTVHDKLADALVPNFQAEFDPIEAEIAGAFVEDALSEADAEGSTFDAPALSGAAAKDEK